MEYAQLNVAGTEAIQITTNGPIAWDANNYCSAEALIKDGRAAPFRVVELTPTSQPAFNAATQKCYRDGCEYVGGVWRYKWTTTALTAQEIAQKTAEAAAALQASIVNATQARLDAFAATRGYDGILSACTYAASAVPRFAAEGQRCVNLRDQTWAALYALLAEVQAGTRAAPSSFADVSPLLPVLSWNA